jgi:hypothetical protein
MRETYRLDLGVTPKQQRVATKGHDGNRATTSGEGDILARSSRTIGDVAFAMLMILVVVAQPLWVMSLLVFVYSR